MTELKKAVVLASGGLDSTTCLAIALNQGFICSTLTINYGQKHCSELSAAAHISKLLGAKNHKEFHLPIGEFGGSALTDQNIAIPAVSDSSAIPPTYVPARNTVLLSIALSFAEIIQAFDIFIGVSAVDYSHYPDCRPEFIKQFQKLARIATKAGVEGQTFTIHAPIIHLSKAETIKQGLALGVDYSQTITCYQASKTGRACGNCDACTLRKKGFREAEIADPTLYV